MLRARLFGAALGVVALTSAAAAMAESIKVGVSAGPHAQIMEQVRTVAAQKDLDIEIIEFTDYVIPNQALSDGDLQANSFQHEPYLDNQVADRGYDLVSVGKTVVFPMGIYSKAVKSLAELKDGARIAVPNDPTNGGRALLLLQANGLITLREGAGLKASPVDIIGNPKNLEIVELDAAQLPRSLDDVAAAAVNTNYAMESGLDPNKDAIARESADSPYTNIIAVRGVDKDKPWVATLLQAYHSPEVKRFVMDTFKGAVAPGW